MDFKDAFIITTSCPSFFIITTKVYKKLDQVLIGLCFNNIHIMICCQQLSYNEFQRMIFGRCFLMVLENNVHKLEELLILV